MVHVTQPVHHVDVVEEVVHEYREPEKPSGFEVLGYHVDCNVSRNIFTTLFFAMMFMLTFSLFSITYYLIWSNLFYMKTNGAEWVFIIFTWVGFSFGGALSYTFFKMVESLKIRGLFICGLLVPLYIYYQYLNWAYSKGIYSDSVQIFFIYAGAVFNGLFGGIAMGLLFAFQGCFTAVYAAPNSLGSQFAVHWFIFPWYYIVLLLFSSWTIGYQTKNSIMIHRVAYALPWEMGAYRDFYIRCMVDYGSVLLDSTKSDSPLKWMTVTSQTNPAPNTISLMQRTAQAGSCRGLYLDMNAYLVGTQCQSTTVAKTFGSSTTDGLNRNC